MSIQQLPWHIGFEDAPAPPKVRSIPYFGFAHKLRYDPLGEFVNLYKRHGSIFRITLMGRDITVMAGLDANRFLNREGNHILNSRDLFGSFGGEFGTDVFLTAMDGPEHLHLRKQARRGYSRSAMGPHLDQLVEIVDQYCASLKPGEEFSVLPAMQYIVTQQLGIVAAGFSPGAYFDDLKNFLRFNINVRVLRMWPAAMMRHPGYLKSKARVIELGRTVLEAHREQLKEQGRPEINLIDDLLVSRDWDGNPYDENMLLAATIGPYFAGIDTVAASLAFLLYNVLHYPDIRARVQAESDTLFQDSSVTLSDIKERKYLHAVVLENLRMYPVAPFTPRFADEPFMFNGYQVPRGKEIYFAQTVTHYLDEYFSEPDTFDPSRFTDNQRKRVPGSFAPYTLGAHLCLGAGLAEAQMMLIAARLLHNLDLRINPPDFPLTVHATPLPNPGLDFQVKVLNHN